MSELFLDLETYSDLNLKEVGAYRYTESPEFMILMAAYALDDDPVQVVTDPLDIYHIPELWNPNTELLVRVAHNAAFERICLTRFGWEVADNFGHITPLPEDEGYWIPPEQWEDTQARAAEWGYPQKLELLAPALGAELKDSAGTRLINLFSKPNRQGRRTLPEEKPEQWEEFIEYCRQDVVTLRDIHRRLPDWPTEAERQAYYTDQRVNDRGVRIDLDLVSAANAAAAANAERDLAELKQVTRLENPNSLQQLGGWLEGQGVVMPNMQKATVESALLDPEIPPKAKRALELRQELALVAAKKYLAADQRTNLDGRYRGGFKFLGAHTGRWTAGGVQMQNLPSATIGSKGMSFEEVEQAIAAAVVDLKISDRAEPQTLKALVRAMLQGPFTVVDYAAIEARVVAWLAGEQWALDAFALGRDIYVETAERMGGLTRKEGKVAVLALGYNGGINSLRVMGAEGTDDKLKYLVQQWREANPAITSLWQEMQHAFRYGGPVGDHVEVVKEDDSRYIVLPSGRSIGYHKLRSRWTVNKWNKRVQVLSFSNPEKHGARTDTYGGKLTENLTQAVARDILAEALVRLDQAGYESVLHIHDEIVVEGDDVAGVKALMIQPPTWSAGLPIAAEGFVCERYRKD